MDIFTLGHSAHRIDRFTGLLKDAGVTAVADVRSSPCSRFAPQYSQDNFKRSLHQAGLAYSFLGLEFGARSPDPSCYVEGEVQYGRLAKTDAFARGVQRVLLGLEKHRIAFVCAEKDPMQCHRALLVARAFAGMGKSIAHIHSDGRLESHADMERRMLGAWGLSGSSGSIGSSGSFDADLEQAYTLQGNKVAYCNKKMIGSPP